MRWRRSGRPHDSPQAPDSPATLSGPAISPLAVVSLIVAAVLPRNQPIPGAYWRMMPMVLQIAGVVAGLAIVVAYWIIPPNRYTEMAPSAGAVMLAAVLLSAIRSWTP